MVHSGVTMGPYATRCCQAVCADVGLCHIIGREIHLPRCRHVILPSLRLPACKGCKRAVSCKQLRPGPREQHSAVSIAAWRSSACIECGFEPASALCTQLCTAFDYGRAVTGGCGGSLSAAGYIRLTRHERVHSGGHLARPGTAAPAVLAAMLTVRRLPWAAGAFVACAKVAGEVPRMTSSGARAGQEPTRRIVRCPYARPMGRSSRAARHAKIASIPTCYAARQGCPPLSEQPLALELRYYRRGGHFCSALRSDTESFSG